MLDSKIPQASVILPVYNGGAFLASAIESVLQQTFSDFELLLLDDGSTDDSLAVMRAFQAKDPRCRVFTRENKGLVYTLNEGVRLARAEVLFRMDADDLCLPTRFALQMEYLIEHSDCVAVGSRLCLIDPDGDQLCIFGGLGDHASIDEEHLKGHGAAICHPAAALRRSAVIAVGGYRAAFKHAEDFDLFLRLAEHGKLANLSDVLFMYRQHPQSIGYKYRAEQLDTLRRAVNEAQERRGLSRSAWPKNAVNNDAATLVDIYHKWAWWALKSGNLKVSRKHALRSLRLAPLSREGWRVMLCGLRGY